MIPAPRKLSPLVLHSHTAFVEVGDEVWVTPVPDASVDSMRFAVAVLS